MRNSRALVGLAGAVLGATALLVAHGVMAQAIPELDRALSKPDPAGELMADFNELAAAAANITPPSASSDQDKAKAAAVRAVLQDPAGLAMARDSARRAAADAAAPRIDAAAARLAQGIGTRLSADASAGMVRDFKIVAEYMAIVQPNDTWYCDIHAIGALAGCAD